MQKTSILLTRHGETEWNLAHRMQGHLDSPLTPQGLAQAEALAEHLKLHTFTAVYSSDLHRAYQTAQCVVAKTGQTVVTDVRLRERNLGIFQGSHKQELETRFPEEFRCYLSRDPTYVIPEGESKKQFFDRCVDYFEEIVQQHPNGTVLVVAHGGVLINLFKHVLAIPLATPRHFSIANASLNLFFHAEGQWRLESWGDVCHLRALG